MTHSRISGIVLAAVGVWWLGIGTAFATLDLQKKAKAAGQPATSCLYCHNEKLPKKGAATPNERGKFLRAEKERRKATEIDVRWLTGYAEKGGEKPARPAEKPAARPTEKPTERPTEKAAEQPTEKPAERPNESPTARATEQTEQPTARSTPCAR